MTTTRCRRLLHGLGLTLLGAALTIPTTLLPARADAAPALAPSDAPACVVGSWEVGDMRAYVQSTIGAAGAGVQVEGASGTMRYQFGADDTFSQRLDGVVIRSRARGLELVQSLDGEVTGRVAEGGTELLELTADTSAITMDATIDGMPFMQGADMSGLALASREYGPTRTAYACSPDRLELTPLLPDGRPVGPLVLTRVP